MGVTGYLHPTEALRDHADELATTGIDEDVLWTAQSILETLDPVRTGGRARTGVAAGAVWLAQELGAGDRADHLEQQEIAETFGRTPQSVRDQARWVADEAQRPGADLDEETRALFDRSGATPDAVTA